VDANLTLGPQILQPVTHGKDAVLSAVEQFKMEIVCGSNRAKLLPQDPSTVAMALRYLLEVLSLLQMPSVLGWAVHHTMLFFYSNLPGTFPLTILGLSWDAICTVVMVHVGLAQIKIPEAII